MIFAAFFPGADGQFDYKLLLVSLLLLFLGVAGVFWRVPLALRIRQVRWTWGTALHIYERDKNPALYWIVCALYFFGSLLALSCFVAFGLGLERVSH